MSEGSEKQDNAVLKQKQLSGTVVYQYWETAGKRTGHALVASGRYHPGIFVRGDFYYGMTAGDRFVPGVIWCEHFIPGLVTHRKGFVPGIVTDSGFTPGMIHSGCFMPGIVNGSKFVPGIVQDRQFVPGCYTTDQMFVPGKIWDHQFENGVFDNNAFIPVNGEKIFPNEVAILSEEKNAFTRVRRFDPVGGVPVLGMIYGSFDDRPWYLPFGLLTNDGAVLGGLHIHFANEREYELELGLFIPAVDPRTALEEVGIKRRYGDDLANDFMEDFEEKGAKILKETEDWFDSMLHGGERGPLGAGSGGGPSESYAESLWKLSNGMDDFIDRINKDWENQWGKLKNNGPPSVRQTKKTTVIAAGAWGAFMGDKLGRAWGARMAITSGAATAAETAAYIEAAGVLGATIGTFLFVGVVMYYGEEKSDTSGSTGSGGSPPQPGTNYPDDNETGDPNTTGPRNINFPIQSPAPKKRKIIEIIYNDTGQVIIVDREALVKAIQAAPKGTKVGYNPITGQTYFAHFKEKTPHEIQEQTMCKALIKMNIDPIYHPTDEVNLRPAGIVERVLRIFG